MAILDGDISGLLRAIYAAPHEEAAWRDALSRFRHLFDAHMLLAQITASSEQRDPRRAILGPDTSRFADAMADYEAELHRHDPTAHYLAAAPAARFVRSDQLFPTRAEEYLRWNKAEVGSDAWMCAWSTPERTGLLALAVHRRIGAPRFDAAEEATLRSLVGHFDHAVELATLALGRTYADHADAIFLLDGLGHLLSANRAGEALLRASDGIDAAGRRLRLASAEAQARLDGLIAEAAQAASSGGSGGMGGALLLPRRSGQPAHPAIVRPILGPARDLAPITTAILLRVTDRGVRSDLSALLRSSFGLTAREARVAQALLSHDGDLRTLADSLAIGHETIRTHMRRIYDKTGTRTQAGLTRLLAAWR